MVRRPLLRFLGCFTLVSALLAPPTRSRAQQPSETDPLSGLPRAQLMLLGSFHFAYPERDVVKSTTRVDVLAPERQRELEQVVERLAAFRPTRIAVEVPRTAQAKLDSLYAQYLDGTWEPSANEAYQVGFRLARRLGHARVHAVDTERAPALLELAERQLAPHEAEVMATDSAWRNRLLALNARADSAAALRYRTLGDVLADLNEPAAVHRSHLIYHVGYFKYDGEEDGYAGVDFVAGWYDRNLRIFRNLQRITAGPDERVLLIIGAGHLPILRFVTRHSPEYELVEPNRYLRPAPGAPAPGH